MFIVTMTSISKIIVFVFLLKFSTSQNFEDLAPLKRGLEEFFHTGNASDEFRKLLQSYQFSHLFREGMQNVYDTPTVCYICDLVVDVVINERLLGMSRDTLAELVTLLCTDLQIEPERVCRGVIDLNVDVFVYIIDNYKNLTSSRVCASLLQSSGCPSGDYFEWSIDIAPGGKPEAPKPNANDPRVTILHLSDIHYDPLYTPGGNALCGEPICCQPDQGESTSPEGGCGYWSDFRSADTPWHLITETIRQAKTQNIDYVYYTGDTICHRVWDTSIEKNSESLNKVYSYFKEVFDVPVFPIFGNHEPHPLNLWPSANVNESFSLNWLFELAAQHWSDLVGEDISETVLKGGYYSVSPKPGFRVIGINSNLGIIDNFWLIYDDVDPYNQLQWLADTLLEAEANNETVHILTHVPTGSSTSLRVWNREYTRIVERFANTITGQFNGHSHHDEFHVYYNSSDPTQPIGAVFNGASVQVSFSNPSFKYYFADETTLSLLDYEEWYFDVAFANVLGPADSVEWEKLYSFVEAYGVENLLPSEVDKALYKMAANHSLLDDYFTFRYRNVHVGVVGTCDDSCKKDLLCGIVTTVYGNDEQCNFFLTLYDQ